MNRPLACLLLPALFFSCSVCPGQETGGRGTGRVDEAEVHAALEEILSDPAYRRLLPRNRETPEARSGMPEWLRRFLEWLFRGRGGRAGSATASAAADVLRFLLYAAVVVLLGAAIALIALAILRRERGQRGDRAREEGADPERPSAPPGELPGEAYVRRARELAAGGDYRDAIRQVLLGTMSFVERAGMIRYRRGLTNRDYVRAVRRHGRRRRALESIVGIFEFVFFGRREATRWGFEECLKHHQEGFGDEKESAAMEG